MFIVMPHAELPWTWTGGDVATCSFATLVPPALLEAAGEHWGLWHNRQQLAEALGNASWLEVNCSTGVRSMPGAEQAILMLGLLMIL